MASKYTLLTTALFLEFSYNIKYNPAKAIQCDESYIVF